MSNQVLYKPEEIVKAFPTAPDFRIAGIDSVHADCACGETGGRDPRRGIVDMIATGTDIKPLEKRRRPVGVLDRVNLPPPAELAAEIVESLEAALEEFRTVEAALLEPKE